jgi:hypothetical protein
MPIQVADPFQYHRPNEAEIQRIERVRTGYFELLETLRENTQPGSVSGRYVSLAITALEESWVVVFDCGEAALVEGIDEEEAWQVKDPLDCLPVAVYPLYRVVLKDVPWCKDGMMRCSISRIVGEDDGQKLPAGDV